LGRSSIKRTADNLVAFENDANNIDVLFNLRRENLQSHCISIASIPIELDIIIDTKIPKGLKPFTGTMKVHQFKWSSKRMK